MLSGISRNLKIRNINRQLQSVSAEITKRRRQADLIPLLEANLHELGWKLEQLKKSVK